MCLFVLFQCLANNEGNPVLFSFQNLIFLIRHQNTKFRKHLPHNAVVALSMPIIRGSLCGEVTSSFIKKLKLIYQMSLHTLNVVVLSDFIALFVLALFFNGSNKSFGMLYDKKKAL